MNAVTMTAMANVKKNKSRNVLIGIAVFLTAFLLTIVPTIGIGTTAVEFAATNKIYPTYHTMFRGLAEEKADQIKEDHRFRQVGLRADPANLICDDAEINVLYCDQTALELNKTKLLSGKLPDSAEEIVVSKGILKAMGMQADVGDQLSLPYQTKEEDGLSLKKERTFRISGMVEDKKDNEQSKLYAAFVSKKFLQEEIPEDQITYRVYARIRDHGQMTKDEIEAKVKEIAKEYEIEENDIVFNSSYLYANYADSAFYAGIAGIMAAIVIAGIITTYSIYYVSMIDKVQEYGKLRAMGATKKQIRRIVFREGFAVAGIAAPIGVAAGAGAGYAVLYVMFTGKAVEVSRNGAAYVQAVRSIIKHHEASIIQPWILILALAVTLSAVYISLLKPMRTASRISPVEAIRYTGDDKKKKSSRRGYQELNVGKLTVSNLSRNKKRTVITILTLACTGIFLIAVATVISCMDPKVMAREEVQKDFRISLDAREGDKMHPERESYRIQQNNPLNDELAEMILGIDGVESVEKKYSLEGELHEILEDGKRSHTGITGVSRETMEEILTYPIEGSPTMKDLEDGTQILLTNSWIYQKGEPKLRTGDQIHLDIRDGEEITEKEFTIAGVVDCPRGLSDGATFVTLDQVMKSLFHSDSVYTFDIAADKAKLQTITPQLQALADSNEFLKIKTFQSELESSKGVIVLIGGSCYALLVIFGLIGILNLINTMINSVYARRRELGMLQAVGLSDSQLLKMLQMEGLFYTAGTVILSLTAGNLAGYQIFLYGKRTGMFSIRTYQYPLVPTIVLISVILLIQIFLTVRLAKDLKKQSLVDRIRFAD